jgi:hypothetical protein
MRALRCHGSHNRRATSLSPEALAKGDHGRRKWQGPLQTSNTYPITNAIKSLLKSGSPHLAIHIPRHYADSEDVKVNQKKRLALTRIISQAHETDPHLHSRHAPRVRPLRTVDRRLST